MGRKYRNLNDLANEREPSKEPPKWKRLPPDYEQRKREQRERARRDKRRGR